MNHSELKTHFGLCKEMHKISEISQFISLQHSKTFGLEAFVHCTDDLGVTGIDRPLNSQKSVSNHGLLQSRFDQPNNLNELNLYSQVASSFQYLSKLPFLPLNYR